MKKYSFLVGVFFGVLIGLHGWGYATTFTLRSDFLTSAGSVSEESFESLTATNTNTLSTINLPNFLITADRPVLGVYDQPSTGGHATGGSQFVLPFDSGALPFTVTFNFNSPINAFGVDITDWESGPGIPLLFSYAGGTFDAAIGSINGNEEFFGIIDSQAFTQIQFIQPSAALGDGWTMDRVTTGISPAPVPEPSSIFLFATGVVGLVWAKWKMRKRGPAL